MTPAFHTLNTATRATAIAMMEPLVERSKWVSELAVDARPFADDDALADALIDTIVAARFEQQLALFKAHPELAGREALEGRMTDASTGEQDRLGLLALSAAEARRLSHLNAAYRERFGYPFIVALHRVRDIAALFAVFESRLAATPTAEHTATLSEIASVIRSRTTRAFGSFPKARPDPAAATLE